MRSTSKETLLASLNAEGTGIMLFPEYLFAEPAFRRYLVKMENLFGRFSGTLLKVGFSPPGSDRSASSVPSYDDIAEFLEEIKDSYGESVDFSEFPVLLYKKSDGSPIVIKGVYAL